MRRQVVAGACWLLLVGCSTARPLAPLPKGAFAAELSAPAVLIANDTFATPVGVLLIGGRYGLSDEIELRVRAHPLPAAFGVVGLEGGAVVHMQSAHGLRPGLHLTGDLSVFTKPSHWGRRLGRAVRGAASVSGIAHWEPWSWLWPYVVLDEAVMLYDGQVVGSLFAGAQLRLGRRWELSLESGLGAINERTARRPQAYVGVGGHGAVWLSWGLSYRFGERTEAGP